MFELNTTESPRQKYRGLPPGGRWCVRGVGEWGVGIGIWRVRDGMRGVGLFFFFFISIMYSFYYFDICCKFIKGHNVISIKLILWSCSTCILLLLINFD